MVVFSLSMVTRLAVPRSSSLMFSSLMPRSSLIRRAAGQHRDVFQHRLATIAEARRFHRADLQRAAQFVHDQGRERFAFHVLGDDEERRAGFRDFLEQRKHVLQARDFFLVNEDVGVLENGFHRFRVRHEVGRQITFVELHALDDFERGLDRFRFLDRDRAVLADLVHRVGDDLADRLVPVGRNGRDLCDLGAVADFLARASSAPRRLHRHLS